MSEFAAAARRLAQISNEQHVKTQATKLAQDLEGVMDYQGRVEAFHDEITEHGDADYLTVLPSKFEADDLPLPVDANVESERAMEEVMAERNRLFWAAFLAEETGEVAKSIISGETPDEFVDEVADVVIICFAMADSYGFDMGEAFDRVMTENEKKPKRQEGTGKLPNKSRREWRQRGEEGADGR